MHENIFVLGLDELNLASLEHVFHAERYRFHGLLSLEELQAGEIDLPRLLDKAERQLDAFDEPIAALVGYWDFPVSSMVPILCERLGLRSANLGAVVIGADSVDELANKYQQVLSGLPFELEDV